MTLRAHSFTVEVPTQSDTASARIRASQKAADEAHRTAGRPANCFHQTLTFEGNASVSVRSLCWVEDNYKKENPNG